MPASRKKRKDDGAPLDPIVPENDLEAVRAETEQSLPRKQYIADLVGEDFKRWKGMVLFDAGTNSGKTYFILKVLLPWADEHHKRILFLCNRDALRNQVERDVCRLGRVEGSYWDYDDELGEEAERPTIENKYECTIRVETYQWLETFLFLREAYISFKSFRISRCFSASVSKAGSMCSSCSYSFCASANFRKKPLNGQCFFLSVSFVRLIFKPSLGIKFAVNFLLSG